MSRQLFLFPELEAQESSADSKKRTRNSEHKISGRETPENAKSTAEPDAAPTTPAPEPAPEPAVRLTAQDFVDSPEGGFNYCREWFNVTASAPLIPDAFLEPYLSRMAPHRNKARKAWLDRLDQLKRVMAEEYVKLHAEAEKNHPEWFRNAPELDPETTAVLPFMFDHVLVKEKQSTNPPSLIPFYGDAEVLAGTACIPLAPVADLVRKHGLHLPTYLKKVSRDNLMGDTTAVKLKIQKSTLVDDDIPVFDILPHVEVACHMPSAKPSATTPVVLRFLTGDVDNLIKANVYHTFEQKRFIPAALSRHQVLGRLMEIHSDVMGTAAVPRFFRTIEPPASKIDECTSTTFMFPIFSETEEDAEIERREIKAAVEAAATAWIPFRDDSLSKILKGALEEVASREDHLMSKIRALADGAASDQNSAQ